MYSKYTNYTEFNMMFVKCFGAYPDIKSPGIESSTSKPRTLNFLSASTSSMPYIRNLWGFDVRGFYLS